MKIHIDENVAAMSAHAARTGAALIREALEKRGECSMIVATGASQLGVLEQLSAAEDIDWSRVSGFHLDEYIGLPLTHPASFRRYLWQRFVSRLPVPMRSFLYLDGQADPAEVCRVAGMEIRKHPVDVAFVGIGENGHLAFNDPPADFEVDEPFIVVALDEACRRQQVGEGWFPTMADVPTHALSMSVRQIMSSRHIICSVPDERKARATAAAVEGPVTPDVPASILQRHTETALFLDRPAASLLRSESA